MDDSGRIFYRRARRGRRDCCIVKTHGRIWWKNGFVWPFDLAQGRAELEFLAGIGFVLALFFLVGRSGILG